MYGTIRIHYKEAPLSIKVTKMVSFTFHCRLEGSWGREGGRGGEGRGGEGRGGGKREEVSITVLCSRMTNTSLLQCTTRRIILKGMKQELLVPTSIVM
jgi:hypothetical protein